MSICEVGQSGERKNPRGKRKKRKKARAGRLGIGLKHHLGTIDLGALLSANNHGAKLGANNHDAKLGAKIYGAKLPAKLSPRLRRVQDLGASNDGAETCNLDASNDGTELRVQILKSYLQGHIYEKISKKWLKIKKSERLITRKNANCVPTGSSAFPIRILLVAQPHTNDRTSYSLGGSTA